MVLHSGEGKTELMVAGIGAGTSPISLDQVAESQGCRDGSAQEHLLLLERTMVQFPAPTRWLSTRTALTHASSHTETHLLLFKIIKINMKNSRVRKCWLEWL